MPLAAAQYVKTENPWDQAIICANCAAPVFALYAGGAERFRFTWHHAYRGWAYSQMTCDPQLAREATKPLMGQLA